MEQQLYNIYMIRSMELGKLERMMLYDARHENAFTKHCIKEAIINARTAQTPLTRAQLETQEALEEEL